MLPVSFYRLVRGPCLIERGYTCYGRVVGLSPSTTSDADNVSDEEPSGHVDDAANIQWAFRALTTLTTHALLPPSIV
jgi:hypothetical protein